MRIYVSTYHKYNSGTLQGDWMDLEDYSDAAEFFEAAKELHEDEEDPEFMFQDFDEVPARFKDESMSESELQELYDFIEMVEDSGHDMEVFEAAEACGIDPSDVDEAYQGKYDSDEDFAEEMAEQLGYMDEKKGWPFNCIDWEYAARELMYDYCSDKGHYFRNL